MLALARPRSTFYEAVAQQVYREKEGGKGKGHAVAEGSEEKLQSGGPEK